MNQHALTRRSFLAGLSACAAQHLFATPAQPHFVLVGTGTRGRSKSRGIYAYRWDAASGALGSLGLAAESDTPAYLAVSQDKKYLYAANEVGDYRGAKDGAVSAFSVNRTTGMLTHNNTVSSGGAGPCHVSVDHSGRTVIVADGAGGSLSSYRVLPGGRLSDPVTNIHFSGHSVNPKRQKGAYTHCTAVSPDNRFLVVNDLGLDQITTFRINTHTAALTRADTPFYQALPGSGPRGFAFHPKHPWAYSVNELLSTIDVLAWNSHQGVLTRRQNLATAPPDFSGMNMPATVQVERTGRFLYLSNRGANTIAAFSIHQSDGTLTPLQQVSCGGTTPRHFTLDPTEQWLLIGNQGSGNISVLKRDVHTGLIAASGSSYDLDSPMCIACI